MNILFDWQIQNNIYNIVLKQGSTGKNNMFAEPLYFKEQVKQLNSY